MADTTALKNRIRAAIKANNNQEITGPVLQQALLDMVDELYLNPELENEAQQRQNGDTQLNNLITGIKNSIDSGYVYAGIATPSAVPVSGKVFYVAVQAGTYTNFGGTAVTEGITILKYNGASWVKEQALFTDGGVFDISAYHATGGTLATYADLTAALGTNGKNIPQSLRKGGMPVKFVQTSDNKYVQYRYTSDSIEVANFVNIKNWVAADVAVKLHGINLLDNSTKEHGKRFNSASSSAVINNGESAHNFTLTPYIEVSEGTSYYTLRPQTSGYNGQYCWFDANKQWIAGGEFDNKWSNKAVLVAPSNAKYFRMSYYDPNTVSTGVMVAESAVEVPYEEYKEWDALSNDVKLNTAHLEQVFNSPEGQKVVQIDELNKRVAVLEGDAEISTAFTPISGTGQWGGSIGETITTNANKYRTRYNKLPVHAGKRYAIINVSGFCAITDENDVILEISYARLGNVLCTWTFVVPEGGAYVYVTSYRTPILYNIVNDNKVVLRQGKKLAYTLNSALTKNTSIEMFKENPYVIPMTGSGSVTMTLGTAQSRVGMWISMTSFDALKFQVNNTLTIKFKDANGTVLRTVSGSGDVAFNYYFSLKRNMFLHWIGAETENNCATIEIAWNISDENVSASMMLYPYAIKDFIIVPTAIFNFEHWSDGREKIEAYINNGIKVTITGTIPSTDTDIAYAREQCRNGMMDYGIYGIDHSLMDSTPINELFENAMKQISDTYQITDKVLSYGPRQHRSGLNGNHAAKVTGIKAFRNYGIVGYIPFVSQDDNDCVCIEMTHTGDWYYHIASYGVSGFFTHTTDLTLNATNATNIGYLKAMIDNNLAQSMTMRELYEKCIDELTIKEYE